MNDITFSLSESTHIEDAPEYTNGEFIGGFRITEPISEVSANIKGVFEVNKPARSTNTNFETIEEGMIVDISYQKASNSVNTPYRVVSANKSRDYNEKFDAQQIDVKFLLEPLIQNASLVIISGHERFYSDHQMQVVEAIYYKSPWEEPTVPEKFQQMSFDSEYNRHGFKRKERRFSDISIVFDEVIGRSVDREDELFSLVV